MPLWRNYIRVWHWSNSGRSWRHKKDSFPPGRNLFLYLLIWRVKPFHIMSKGHSMRDDIQCIRIRRRRVGQAETRTWVGWGEAGGLFTISLLLQVGYRKKKGAKAAPLRHCISSLRLLGFRQTAVWCPQPSIRFRASLVFSVAVRSFASFALFYSLCL